LRTSDLLADKVEFDAGNDDKGGIDVEFDEGLEKGRNQNQNQGPNVNFRLIGHIQYYFSHGWNIPQEDTR
jgi:hypothetical protein